MSFFFSSDPSFAYVGRSDDVTDIHCDFRGRGLGVRCLLGNPYASNRTDSLLFRVAPSQSSPFVQNSASFSVVTNTSSEDIGATSDRTHEIEVCNLSCIRTAQYGNFRIFMPFRFYVKSILANFRWSKTAILAFLEALNFDFLVIFTFENVTNFEKF